MTSEQQPAAAPHESSTPGEAAQLEQRLEEALREKEQFRTIAQRAQADLANYKRHASEELEDIRKFGASRLLLKVLGVADDFRRAMEFAANGQAPAALLEGLKLVQRNLDQVLESEGVKRIEAEGQPYDPHQHEALFFVETDAVEPGHVVNVVRQGYRLQDRLLRAAQVTVSRPPQPKNQPDTSEQRHEER
ncbi:MAG: nucleotide exchange factor GrpE [SAR202 cluster bacterium]|nr:nucleotide exchange factor GrpE [SAR202 cluster bacterium]